MNSSRTAVQTAPDKASKAWVWPLLMAFIRLPVGLIGNGAAILAYQWSGRPVGIAAGLGWSTFTLTIINLLCIGLLVWRARVEGLRLSERIGFRWNRLLPDIAWGLLWSAVLATLLLIGVMAVLLVWYGSLDADTFAAAFTGSADFSFSLPAWLAVFSAVIFPLVNAPVEELQYRGYAQPGLSAAWGSTRAGIIVSALGFGLQHTLFAVTVPAAVAYSLGFFLWGAGAGLIANRQRRLIPLIVAHFISNLSFGVIPLIMINSA